MSLWLEHRLVHTPQCMLCASSFLEPVPPWRIFADHLMCAAPQSVKSLLLRAAPSSPVPMRFRWSKRRGKLSRRGGYHTTRRCVSVCTNIPIARLTSGISFKVKKTSRYSKYRSHTKRSAACASQYAILSTTTSQPRTPSTAPCLRRCNNWKPQLA